MFELQNLRRLHAGRALFVHQWQPLSIGLSPSLRYIPEHGARHRRDLARSHREVSYGRHNGAAWFHEISIHVREQKRGREKTVCARVTSRLIRVLRTLFSRRNDGGGNAIIWTPIISSTANETACLFTHMRGAI